ncbi:MAG: PQQ-binding-like beta-propeller repeat protein [Chitinophagales bacterium]|jgi:eukaryotic-like serine/threonine-protein kinase|nr:PQQ-binding-like beta-propeller repeat protein [Chitinophagales bacterium]
MLQRWMKSLAVVGATCAMFASCKKHTYSPDEPLVETNTPSVFTASQNKIMYAIDPSTGKYKWQRTLTANVIATPVIVGNYVYVASEDSLYKFNAKSGKFIKAMYPIHVVNPNLTRSLNKFYSSPVTDGKVLYIADIEGDVFAIQPKNDDEDEVKWSYDAADSVKSSLIMYNGNIVVVTTKGAVKTVSMANGTGGWTSTLPTIDGGLKSSPVASGPYIYIGSPDYNLYALNVANGNVVWNFATDGAIDGSPVAYGGNIIFGSADNYVYCVDSTARTARWKFKTNDRVHSTPAAYGQVVYVGGYDAYIYALNIIDGSIKWKYQTGALIQASLLATDGSVYVSGFDKQMYKFDTSGKLRWRTDIGGPIQSSPVFYDLNKAYYPSITGFGPY